MSRKKFLGTELDRIHQTQTGRSPKIKVEIWNPNRTNVNDVVLGRSGSPAYDVTSHVRSIGYNENIVWENNDDAVASSLSIDVARDPDALPIPIDETTFIDGAPIRLWLGDARVPDSDWVPIFTGVLRGNPAATEHSRSSRQPQTITVTAVDRAERYLSTVVTARAYDRGQDVGKAAVETAIERMYLNRREVKIGYQGYGIGHTHAQLVDIEVLKGIHQILFTVGKKPKFDGEGYLVAADTDLNKVPTREYRDKSFVTEVVREPAGRSLYNSVRLLGLDDELTAIIERDRRIAHGTITSGFFEEEVRLQVFFSEDEGEQTTGRRAKNTHAKFKVATIGILFGQNATWEPVLESDGYTTFSGWITFDTGAQLAFRIALLAVWSAAKVVMEAALSIGELTIAAAAEVAATTAMTVMLLTLLEIGFVEWEVYGEPFQNVYQQLAATAQRHGVLTEEIKDVEVRNDWLYDIDYMRATAKELLRRELIKSWAYTIKMLDDPLLEVDDVIAIEDRRYYITSIRRRIERPWNSLVELTAWRLA